jgi:two-component system chemotaxis response regulator CheY
MARVLIVDDSNLTRIRLRKLLEKMGHEIVAEATDGLEGIKKYQVNKPDLVTMDINMPEMNGVESLKGIREVDPDAAVIMISTEGQERLIQEVISHGAKYFIIKPFKPMQLLSVVRSVLEEQEGVSADAKPDLEFLEEDPGGVVLTIDDSKTVLEKLRILLKEGNHNVLQADSGRMGIDFALSGRPDLVLLDLNMPDMNGFEVLKELGKTPFTRNIPVMILSGQTKREDVMEAMKYGVVDYASKDLEDESFLQKVKTALTRSRKPAVEAEDEEQAVIINREADRTTLLFRRPISKTAMEGEMREVFSRTFINMIKKNHVVLDLRGLLELGREDIENLQVLLSLLQNVDTSIVAGRHYGALVTESDIFETWPVFISHGDLEIYLDSR